MWLVGLYVISVLNGCTTQAHVYNRRMFLYKPQEESPAYIVRLPRNSEFKMIIRGRSDCYAFTYNDAVFYISEEDPYKSNDTLYNYLLKMQQIYQSGGEIDIPSSGFLIETGKYGNSFWKYRLIYNLEKPDPFYRAGKDCFEHLYVGYTLASESDTAELNNCISSAIPVERFVKKHKANKIIRKYHMFQN